MITYLNNSFDITEGDFSAITKYLETVLYQVQFKCGKWQEVWTICTLFLWIQVLV
jgi:hypothetical protein